MESFLDLVREIINIVSFGIGVAGVLVILSGTVQTFWLYCFQHNNVYFGKLRLVLNTHFILGLDLFIGKDIIDTFLADTEMVLWQDMLRLIVVILIRIVLSYFLNKEIESLNHKGTQEILEK